MFDTNLLEINQIYNETKTILLSETLNLFSITSNCLLKIRIQIQ
jgi:hypothetical protein